MERSLFNKLGITILLTIFLATAHVSLCHDSDTSTNINSSNENLANERPVVEDASQLDPSTLHGSDQDKGDPSGDDQEYQHRRRNRPHYHETLLRVIDPEQEPTTSKSSRNPPDPIIEVGEMVVEDVREDDTTSKTDHIYDAASTKKNTDNRPNIILIMTDDQDVELGSMEYMPETLKIFRDNGIEFRHGYVATPMCCPSRSSILTGQYVHNHNVYTNNDNCSSVLWREKYEKRTFGAHLWSSGYYTSYIGKYLNKYDGSHIPFGWDEWNGLLMNSRFYNYTVNVNGNKFRHGNEYEFDYYPDLITNDTLDFLTKVGNDDNKRPFLLVSSFPSPHGPEDSAPQYSNMFMNSTPHHTKSYDFAPNLDKQWILRQTNPMSNILKDFTNILMTKRLQTLQSVDVGVKLIMDKLKATGLDKNTYIFYTSDHGYHVGQFGLVKGKSMPYEFDIRVPFYVRGPENQVKRGTRILEPVLNIDLSPTFLDLAGIEIPDEMDGRSILPLINKYGPRGNAGESEPPVAWRNVFLIESSGRRESPPSSTPSDVAQPKKSKRFRDEQRKLFQTDTETLRLNSLCLLHPYPCLPGQKKYCRKERDQEQRLQFRKCRHPDFLEDPFLSPQNNYQLISTNATSFFQDSSYMKCQCRHKRSTDLELNRDSDTFEWDAERKIIDDEIESLKKRIDELRHRRRFLRRKWLLENNHPTSTTTSVIEEVNATSRPIQSRQGKGYEMVGIDTDGRSNTKEGKVFSTDDFESEDEQVEPTFSASTTTTSTTLTTTTTATTTVRESEEEEDEDDDLDEDEEDENEDDENDTSEDEDDEDEERHVVVKDPPTHPTTTTTSSTPIPTKTSRISGKGSNFSGTYNKSYHHGTSQRRPTSGTRKRKLEQGLHFENDFEMDSFVRPKVRNKNRHKNRSRQKPKLNGQVVVEPKWDSDIIKQINVTHQDLPQGPNEESQNCDCQNYPRWIRQREREERKRKKIISKIRKKQKYMKRIDNPEVRKQAETCGAEEKMNCFWHDSEHWKTAPFWDRDRGSFCFCMNSNNNTYSCLRSVNATHNYLYCQFVTGFKMYFDLRQDPYQLVNAIGTLPATHEDWMLVQLIRLKKCKGRAECWGEIDNQQAIQSTIWEQIFGRWPRKKKRGHRRKHVF